MKVYSVSEFVKTVSAYLEQGLGTVAVQGEIVDWRVNQGRLVFFELKDKEARVLCFCLKWEISQELEDGVEVKVYGLPKLFKKSGSFHLRVIEIELVGKGALQKAYQNLKAKLEGEGLFALERKKPLPRFPQKIGLITSRQAAAYNDVLIRLQERWPGLTIYFLQTNVQGLGAVQQIIEAIHYFNEEQLVDVLILTRGGGSLEDLQSFNNEQVVRSVFASKIPIVVGVGHERDVTLAELAADARASTPTNAAELVVPHYREIAYQLDRLSNDLSRIFLESIDRYQEAVVGLIQRTGQWLDLQQQRFNHLLRLLISLNPQQTLKRGYSITFKGETIVTKMTQVKKGDIIKSKFYQGEVESQII